MTAGALSVAVGATLIHRFATHDYHVEATDTDRAILVDLAPALAASQAARDAQEGPEQEPSEAAPDAPAPPLPVTELNPATPPDPLEKPKPVDPPPVDPPKSVEPPMPVEDPVPVDPPKPLEPPKPIEKPKPIEERVEKPTPPPTAAPSPAVTEQAPTGSQTPVAGEHPDSDDGQPRASAHAITAWQRSLVGRIEVAKHALTGHRTAAGTVQVAFAIDHEGHVVTERVAHSSGSPALDDTALLLVRRAAPFPIPPLGVSERDLSFIVPIRFRY